MLMGRWRKGLAGATLVLLTLFAADRVFPPDLSRAESLSQEVLDRDGALLRAYLTDDHKLRLKTDASDVPSHYLDLLTTFEDQRFFYHPGIDPLALARAIGQAATTGRIISGASTLTMQTARLLEPRPRTLSSKLIEMVRAVQLELRFDKNEILALYLTLAPFGSNIEGVQAASRIWFGKPAALLTPSEAALLVALPQSPERLRPDRHRSAALAARDKVLRRAAELGLISHAAADEHIATGFNATRHPVPAAAPHFANRVRATQPTVRAISTTIDAALQRSVTEVLRDRIAKSDRTHSAAALVLDLSTKEVVAYVGSPDIADRQRLGALDMVQAVRSPGSALKPFLYASAFEAGWLHPLTGLGDVPRRFGTYAPANFNLGYDGRVTVEQALQTSLNIPAVAVLDRYGPLLFVERMQRAGAELHLPQGPLARPGLSVILGGVGITLDNLTNLYAALATDGRLPGAEGHVATPAAAWQTLDILRRAPRPVGLPATRHIAFKTGTSYGFRDAWAIGTGNRYAVGVWTGRVDGTPVPGATGIGSAAPLLFSIFSMLEPNPTSPPSAPVSVLAARSTYELPIGLQRLDFRPDRQREEDGAVPLAIAFPPDGAVLELAHGRGFYPMPLEAVGGAGDLRWMVNGHPLAPGSATNWIPDGYGFATLTVRDRRGNSVSNTVRIQ